MTTFAASSAGAEGDFSLMSIIKTKTGM